jgi:alpha/beta superfamily hydrolase
MIDDQRSTRRVDASDGTIEELSYFGETPQMFGSMHIPAGDIRACVVICSSTHAELLKSYHLEVRAARALAGRGIAVHRFQYRGEGNSDGGVAELTLPAMVSATSEAMDRLVDRTGTSTVAFIGVRMGAFPAVTLAQRSHGAPIVLWDPVLDTDRFMRDALRSHAIAALKGEAKPDKTSETLERLERDGSIDLLGYEFTSGFYESIQGRKLTDQPPAGSKVLVVPFGSSTNTALLDVWRSEGVDVSTSEGTEREAWWLDEQATRDRQNRGSVLADLTATWLSDTIDG